MRHPFLDVLRALGAALRLSHVRAVLGFTFALIVMAALVYWWIEGWSLLDALYFSVITISTVGYGDFSPQTAAGKIFTIGYIVAGLGVFVAAVTTLAEAIFSERARLQSADQSDEQADVSDESPPR